MIVFAQDIIVTKKSERIDATVLEINVYDVKYKQWNNQNGPTYTVLKSDIASIIYQSGTVETFTNSIQPQQDNNNRQHNYSDGTMTLSVFKSMSDREQDEYLKKYVGGDIYDKFHSGVKLKRAGVGLLIPGLALSVAGLVCTIVGAANTGYYYSNYYHEVRYYYDDVLTVGLVLLPVGEALVITSIPLSATGGAKKKRAQNEYIDTYLKGTSMSTYKPALDFGSTTNGVGLTFKF